MADAFITRRGGGGGAKWNVLTQTIEPSASDGLWIKRDDVSKVEFSELIAGDGSFVIKSAQLDRVEGVRCAAAECDGLIYTFGSDDETYARVNDGVYKYDPINDVITKMSAKFQRYSSRATSVDSIIYLFGGRIPYGTNSTSATNGNAKYDTESDIITSIASADISAGEAIPVNRQIYLFGSASSSKDNTVPRLYDIDSNIVATAAGSPLESAANGTYGGGLGTLGAGRIGNKIYIYGTTWSSDRNGASTTIWRGMYEYDIINHTSSRKLEFTLNCSKAISYGGKLYMLVPNSTTNSSELYTYDPITNAYSVIESDVPGGYNLAINSACGMVAVDSLRSIFFLGGYNYLRQITQYKISSNDYDTGTAIVRLILDNPAVLLYKDNKFALRANVDRVFYQTDDGLITAEAATNSNGAGWTDI